MHHAVALTALACAGLVLAGCAQDPKPLPPATGASATESSSTSSASPSNAPTETDPELATVIQRAQAFEDTQNAIVDNPKRSIDDISLVARGEASGWAKQSLQQFRAEGYTTTGKIEVRDVTAKHLKAGQRPRAQVRMCFDTSDYVIKDAKGKTITFPTATSMQTRTLEQWGDTWYVTKVGSRDEDC